MPYTLKETDIFYNLSPQQLDKIEGICTQMVLNKGTVIFEENTFGDEMYIVTKGSVNIQVDPKMLGLETDPRPTTIATLRKGQIFGEIALVDQGLRSASAQVAQNDTHLLALRRADLLALCEQDYELGYLIMRNIAAELSFKIRGTDLMIREQLLWRPTEPR
jgi:CRP-like cAMP-binding protein